MKLNAYEIKYPMCDDMKKVHMHHNFFINIPLCHNKCMRPILTTIKRNVTCKRCLKRMRR